jgi:hypothetical protein
MMVFVDEVVNDREQAAGASFPMPTVGLAFGTIARYGRVGRLPNGAAIETAKLRCLCTISRAFGIAKLARSNKPIDELST